MSWAQYLEALNGSIDTMTNTGFRLCEQGIVTSWGSMHTMTSKSLIRMEFIQNLYGKVTPIAL